ncbi:MAG: putative peptidoglycan binding protein [Verrucomicrobiales bacterium]|nr:putative peptidoglycan binding protein [Verrucomicrobiales bacterium]
MKSYVLYRSIKPSPILQTCGKILAAGLLAFGISNARAGCGHVDNFSYNYPAYNANWSQEDCENYAASGIGHCYSFGGDGGWGGATDGVDCSAYCARVWAIPGHINASVTGAHPYSTYSWYPNDGSVPTPPAHTHFVTVSDITDIHPYDCFVVNANFGNLGIHHMGLIESVDYAGGIIYTREAHCSSAPTSGCDGPDGIHNKSWTYSSLVTGGRARIIRRNDWGPSTQKATVGPVALNSNGALDIFGVGSDTAVWHDQQAGPNGSFNGWATLSQIGSVPGCTTAANKDGRLEVYVVNSAKNVMRKYQTTAGGPWSAWASLGGNGFTNLQAVANLDGRIELFAVGTNGDIWHTWQTAANGSFIGSWFDRTGKKIKPGYQVEMNDDGRLELFGVAADGHAWHNYQTNAGSGWIGWSDLGIVGTGVNPALAVGHDSDGRLELFGLGSNGDIWVNFQTSAGGSYSGWFDIGGNGMKAGFVVGKNSTGRLEMFAVGSNSDVWHSFQVNAGGAWSTWRDIGSAGMNRQLAVGNNADGRLQVFGIGSNGHVLSNFQLTPGGDLFGWLDMAGAGTKLYYGQ